MPSTDAALYCFVLCTCVAAYCYTVGIVRYVVAAAIISPRVSERALAWATGTITHTNTNNNNYNNNNNNTSLCSFSVVQAMFRSVSVCNY
jgi:hypothetical protein